MKYGTLSNFVGGRSSAFEGPRRDVVSPVDGSVLATMPLSDEAELDRAVQAAKKAHQEWAGWTLKERASLFFKYYDVLSRNQKDLARLIHEEMGKDVAEAQAEVAKSLELVEFACSLPQVCAGEHEVVSRGVECRIEHVPLGVVASVCPFNFPHMVPHWTIPNALILGNAMIVKPSPAAPLTAIRTAEMLTEVGLPEGVLNVVCGEKKVVEALWEHSDVQAITFVGSTMVGRLIYKNACARYKRVLALGSANNHLILLPDAHPENTASNIAASFIGCAGQRCMSACVMVAVGESDHIIGQIVEEARRYVPGKNMGAIVSKEAKERIVGFIDRAVKDGAKVLLDGRGATVPGKEKGVYLGPTILDQVKPGAEIAREENFGPVLTIVRAQNLSEAITLANSSPYGNGSSIFTQNGRAAELFVSSIQAGMVGVNIGVPVPREPFSFGGWKDSITGVGDITGKSSIGFWTKLKKVSTKWNPDKQQNWMS